MNICSGVNVRGFLVPSLSKNSGRMLFYNTRLTYLLTYLLTQWCRVLLQKLTGLQQVKKFPAFHRTRRFITALTSVRHLSLSWASPIQSIYPQPTSWRSILILSTHLRLGLPSGLFPSGTIQGLYFQILFRHFFKTVGIDVHIVQKRLIVSKTAALQTG